MKKLIIAGISILLTLANLTISAKADCILPTVEEFYQNSDVVFRGQVTSSAVLVGPVIGGLDSSVITYQIAVTTIWKGENLPLTVEIKEAVEPAPTDSWRPNLAQNQQYIFGLVLDNGEYSVGTACYATPIIDDEVAVTDNKYYPNTVRISFNEFTDQLDALSPNKRVINSIYTTEGIPDKSAELVVKILLVFVLALTTTLILLRRKLNKKNLTIIGASFALAAFLVVTYLYFMRCYDCCGSNPFSSCRPVHNRQLSFLEQLQPIYSTYAGYGRYALYENGDLYYNKLGKGNDVSIHKTNINSLSNQEIADLRQLLAKNLAVTDGRYDIEGPINEIIKGKLAWTEYLPKYIAISITSSTQFDKLVKPGNTENQLFNYYVLYNQPQLLIIDPLSVNFNHYNKLIDGQYPVEMPDSQYEFGYRMVPEHMNEYFTL